MPHHGHRLPRMYVQIEMVDDLRLFVVGEGDIFDADIPLGDSERHGIRFLCHIGPKCHQFHEPGQSRGAIGEDLRKIGKLADGGHKGVDEQGEGDQVDVVQVPFHDQVTTERDHGHRHDAHEKLLAGVECTHGLIIVALGPHKRVIGFREPLPLHTLVGKGLAGADTRDACLDLRIDGG